MLDDSISARDRDQLQPFTDEDRAAQQLMTLIVLHGRKNAGYYRAETRRLLEAVRDGTAADWERQRVLWAVRQMSTEREPSKASNYARQVYVLTLKYLAPDRLDNKEIARLINLDVSNVCRDATAAIERIAFWLFGVSALPWK